MIFICNYWISVLSSQSANVHTIRKTADILALYRKNLLYYYYYFMQLNAKILHKLLIDRLLKLFVSNVRTVLDTKENVRKKQQKPMCTYTRHSNIRRSGVWLIRAPGYRALWLRFQSRSPYVYRFLCAAVDAKKGELALLWWSYIRSYIYLCLDHVVQDPRQLPIAWSSSHVYHGHLTQLAHTLPRKELITQIY